MDYLFANCIVSSSGQVGPGLQSLIRVTVLLSSEKVKYFFFSHQGNNELQKKKMASMQYPH